MNKSKSSTTNFLSDFTRSDSNYLMSNNPELIEAYQAGFYDCMIKNIIESNVRITGKSFNPDELMRFFQNAQDNGIFIDDTAEQLTTIAAFEKLISRWYLQKNEDFAVTQFYLAAGKEHDCKKLADIVMTFLKDNFTNYAFTEHNDTDQLHYHVATLVDVSTEDLSSLREQFYLVCKMQQALML